MNFDGSREDKFLTSIIEHVEDSNIESFTDEMVEWNRIKGLDPLLTSLLSKIKNSSGKNKELLLNKNSYLDKHSYSINKFGYYPSRKLVCKKELSDKEKEHLKTNMF